MQLITDEQIKKLMTLFQEAYGKDIDKATAKMVANWFLIYSKKPGVL